MRPGNFGSEALIPDFWRGKRVFLTGHTGFKGSWLSLWLAQLGATVQGFALPPPTEPNLFRVARVNERIGSSIGDIRDLAAVQTTMLEFQPDIVIHMAAQPLVRASYEEPVATYATNVMGTVHVMEAVRHTPSVRCAVNVTTDKCYENREWIWGYRENDPLGGHDPYSSSKGCSELVTHAYRNSFFHADQSPAIASARAGNVIGGGDWAKDRLIPDILRAFERSTPAIIRHPAATRPWQHVLEPLSGYLSLAEKLWQEGAAFAQAWNFGPEQSDIKPVGWIAGKMVKLWGKGSTWEQQHPASVLHEAHSLRLDSSKAMTLLGWAPTWNLTTALERTVAWQQAWLTDANMRDYCEQEINRFMHDSTGRSNEF